MLPLISQDPTDPNFGQNPYPFYRDIRTASLNAPGNAVHWQEYDLVCFPHYDDVNKIFRDRRFGRQILHVMSREELGWSPIPDELKPFYAFEQHSLLELEPPDHTRLRKLVNRAFVARAVELLRPEIATLAHELIDRFPTSTPIDLIGNFCEPIPVNMISRLLGVPQDMGPQMVAWSHDMVAMYQANRDTETQAKAVEATTEFSQFMRGYIADRRKAPGDDLLSELITAEEEGGKLSEDELVTTAILLLNAGHEATVHGIGNGIKTILQNKVDVTSLLSSSESMAWAVEETLRFDPPLHLFTRFVLEDLEWKGLSLKKGQSVGLLLGSANRDPMVWENADQFDPTRRPLYNVAFGAGIHFCIGTPLARLEIQEAFRVLFSRLPKLKLADTPRYADRFHFHGLEKLNVITN